MIEFYPEPKVISLHLKRPIKFHRIARKPDAFNFNQQELLLIGDAGCLGFLLQDARGNKASIKRERITARPDMTNGRESTAIAV